MARSGRAMAIVVIAMALLGLGLRTYVDLTEGMTLGASVWDNARFFTILTNAGIAIVLGLHLARPGGVGPSALAGATLAIGIVGVVYHVLLADLVSLQGRALVADVLFHTAVPLGMAVWWGLYAPKAPLGPLAPLRWLVWPLVYSIYAVARGLLDGTFPYYFLNVDELGWGGLAVSVAQFCAAFVVAGYALWGVAKLIGPRQSARPS